MESCEQNNGGENIISPEADLSIAGTPLTTSAKLTPELLRQFEFLLASFCSLIKLYCFDKELRYLSKQGSS